MDFLFHLNHCLNSSFSNVVSVFRYSECYFAVRGAAVILPKHECMMPVQSNSIEGGGREIQQHLQTMLQLLRSQDTLKMVRPPEQIWQSVSTVGRQDNQEFLFVIGIDWWS
ncbi:protein phosphatase Slingshot [Trichinella spiralis]|uniref:protein phosphatase Slingshot n=1 Tax=Trichinella spiralis TaxID=6334 RepID=UPI0001EFDC71|nr:protein phosphatase Slingshot [Trichinella spiralis]